MEMINKLLGLAIVIVFVALLISVPVYFLWNLVIPEICGFKSITLFQALLLSLLGGCLSSST
jgi:hypothetical protein